MTRVREKFGHAFLNAVTGLPLFLQQFKCAYVRVCAIAPEPTHHHPQAFRLITSKPS